jgi:adenylyltransferase/sulfurtransferase
MITSRDRERYKRQIMLFGTDGQERLRKAHVFIAGAGGLGSPVSMYLAAAGVGRITIADMDVVDRTNLNRQLLHADRDIGQKKANSAQARLSAINPDITINALDARIEPSNASRLVGDADGIVDAMDNYDARYILNDAAFEKQIPLFHGGIRGFYGQATTIIPGRTACLRCLVPRCPPEEVFPAVGATAGFIGTVQATEVIKYLVNTGELLENRLLVWDGLVSRAEEIALERNPKCPVCGDGRGEGKKGGAVE